jgi:hypothetical protein
MSSRIRDLPTLSTIRILISSSTLESYGAVGMKVNKETACRSPAEAFSRKTFVLVECPSIFRQLRDLFKELTRIVCKF